MTVTSVTIPAGPNLPGGDIFTAQGLTVVAPAYDLIGPDGYGFVVANLQMFYDIIQFANAAVTQINGLVGGQAGSSHTSHALADRNAQSFTIVESTAAFTAGAMYIAASLSTPSAKLLFTVTSYTFPTLVTNVSNSAGAGGPYTDWVITPVETNLNPVFVPKLKTGAQNAHAADIGGVWSYTAAATHTLDAATSLGASWYQTIQATTGAVVIATNGSDDLNSPGASATSYTIQAGDSAMVFCTGTAGATAFYVVPMSGPKSGSGSITSSTALTSSSSRRNVVKMTAFDQVITMPDARGLPPGDTWSFVNKTSKPAKIANNLTGTLIGAVLPGKTTAMTVDDVSTQDGVWSQNSGSVNNDNGWAEFGPTINNGVINSGVGSVQCILLSIGATISGVIIYTSTSSTVINALGFKYTGPELQVTPSVNIATGLFAQYKALRVNTTEACIFYTPSTAGNFSAVTLDLNTTTMVLTLNTPVTIDTWSSSVQWLDMDIFGTTLFFSMGYASGTNKINAATVAAGVIVAGTAALIESINTGTGRILALSATLAHTWTWNSSGVTVRTARHTAIGTVVTPGAVTAHSTRKNLNGAVKLVTSALTTFATYEDSAGGAGGSLIGATMVDTGSAYTFTETVFVAGISGATGPAHQGMFITASGTVFVFEQGANNQHLVQINFSGATPSLGVSFPTPHEGFYFAQPQFAETPLGDYMMFGWTVSMSSAGTSLYDVASLVMLTA